VVKEYGKRRARWSGGSAPYISGIAEFLDLSCRERWTKAPLKVFSKTILLILWQNTHEASAADTSQVTDTVNPKQIRHWSSLSEKGWHALEHTEKTVIWEPLMILGYKSSYIFCSHILCHHRKSGRLELITILT